ncbi:MAG TPA: type 1 glutamine amidotransferase domain-containing protein [Candidatus Dormibacteraeota bacterium]|jgi:putative intracellular protease/amidase
MAKKVLCILSEYGYWGEELVGPLEALDAHGYDVVFATSRGRRPPALPPSMDEKYVDPPLGRPVVSADMAGKTRTWDQSSRLEKPLNLATWLPEKPYRSSSNYLREQEAYNNRIDEISKELDQYAALLIVGGSGPIVDMVNNHRVHELILDFYRKNKPIAAECYGVTCLAFARSEEDRKSIIWGRHVTGHPIEYDYHDGTGFVGTDLNMGPPPYPLEYILRDAVGPEGQFHGNVGHETSVIVDYPFITGRSTADSVLTGQMLVEVLDQGRRVYGWHGPDRFAGGQANGSTADNAALAGVSSN